MSKKLMIIESPNKREKLQKILKQKNDGSTWDIKATVGHFTNLADVGEDKIGLDKDFNPIFSVDSKKQNYVSNFLKDATSYDEIHIATDPDREGEAIGYHVQEALVKKYGDKILHKIKRTTFNEISAKAVRDALLNSSSINMSLVNSQMFRQCADKMFGFKGSRIVQRASNFDVKSAGRVQSVALKLVKDREIEVDAWTPIYKYQYEPYIVDDQGNKTPLKHIDIHTKKKIDFDDNTTTIKLGNNVILTKNEQSDSKKESPPPLYMTVTLQQDCDNSLNITPSQTMNLAQTLFEKGLITYHRTDTEILSKDFYDEVLMPFLENSEIKDNHQLRNVMMKYKIDENAQQGHEGIRVVDINFHPHDNWVPISKNGSEDEKLQSMYEMIYNRTILQGLADEEYIVDENYFEDEEHNNFIYSQNIYLTNNWKAFKQKSKHKNQKDAHLTLNKRYELYNKDLVKFVANKKPSYFTQMSLIKELKKLNIGRPSTFATYPKLIVEKNWVDTHLKKFRVTNLGNEAYNLNEKYLSNFINVNFTKEKIEDVCDMIAQKNIDFKPYLKKFNDELNQIKKGVYESTPNNEIKKPQSTSELSSKFCEVCNAFRKKITNAKGTVYFACENTKWNSKTKSWDGCEAEFEKKYEVNSDLNKQKSQFNQKKFTNPFEKNTK